MICIFKMSSQCFLSHYRSAEIIRKLSSPPPSCSIKRFVVQFFYFYLPAEVAVPGLLPKAWTKNLILNSILLRGDTCMIPGIKLAHFGVFFPLWYGKHAQLSERQPRFSRIVTAQWKQVENLKNACRWMDGGMRQGGNRCSITGNW